ncbi:hypothetical protein EDB89DRAFT_1912960 [Lactarius sanguifluus]|nr:hypothetical protein EDB89DRAFT_1912960 [Lactarius sanguifluus]
MPLSRMYRAARAGREVLGQCALVRPLPRKWGWGWCALVYMAAWSGGLVVSGVSHVLPSAQMGKGGAVGGVPSHAPFPHVHGGVAKGEEGRGGGGANVEWWGRCVPPFRTNEKGRDQVVSLCMGGLTKGKGEGPGAMCPHAPPFRANGVVQTGRREDLPDGGRHCVPLICVRRGQRWSVRGREGVGLPLGPLFDANRVGKGGERGGKEGEGKGHRPCGGSKMCLPHRGALGNGAQKGKSPSSSPYPTLTTTPSPCLLQSTLPIRTEGKECTRGHAAATSPHGPSPSPSPLAALPRAENGHTIACHPSPLPPGPSPSPFDHAILYAREGGHATPSPTPPIHLEGGCMRAHPTRHLPSPLATPPRTRGKGAHEGTPPTAPPFPICTEGSMWDTLLATGPPNHTTMYTRAHHPWPHSHGRGGARGHTAPAPPFQLTPPCTRGKGAHDGHTALAPPFDRTALSARERGTQGHMTPGPTLPIHVEGAHTRVTTPSFSLGALRHTRGQVAREGKPPHPMAPHSCGKGHTRPPTSLHVAQRGQCDLHAPAFTMPALCRRPT